METVAIHPAARPDLSGLAPGKEGGRVDFFSEVFGREFIFDVEPAVYLQHATAWQQLGAAFIGGCCGTRPAHIAALARGLRRA